MTKRVLTLLVISLFFLLMGLTVLYFYVNRQPFKKNSILNFIPGETLLIVRIKETSKTTNQFFFNTIARDCFELNELKTAWNTIDSITSRNYKTSEILSKNTSYICIDSSLNYLVLIDLDKKANEHFIDQFLANSTPQRKMKKFEGGYKAFYPSEDQPIYYLVVNNVFGISNNQHLIQESFRNHQIENADVHLLNWDQQSTANLTFYGKTGAEKKVMGKWIGDLPMWDGWLDKLAVSFWLDVSFDSDKLSLNGELNYDSLNKEIRKFTTKNSNNNYFFSSSDTLEYINKYYHFSMLDSTKKEQSVSFVYHHFIDSLGLPVELFISNSPMAALLFQTAIHDSTVQIIPMADETISQIAAMDQRVATIISPLIPFKEDTGKVLGTIFNNYLFLSTSTESILLYAKNYPSSSFIKNKLEAGVFIFSSEQVYKSHPYLVEYKYQWLKGNRVLIDSKICRKTAK